MAAVNLNNEQVRGDSLGNGVLFRDYSIKTNEIDVHFRELEMRLVELIADHSWAAGNVAWLTSLPILDALSRLSRVSIIVQKEDFLRPDKASQHQLHKAYDKIRGSDRLEWPHINELSTSTDQTMQAIRCVGNLNTEKKPAHPRAHNKFLVLGKYVSLPESDDDGVYKLGRDMVACCVWTGSFNFTYNATRSLENAVVIRQSDVVGAYLAEWGQIAAISEPLDWFQPWVQPEWRIGT
ncbi:hypothetical protein AB0C07_24540 [Actinoplanes missouriensis]|uniref:hypothetical protein n=1 Tax=Actinoplanes missouriensis TaxID=1866 RepID=UPI003403E406